MRITNDLNGTAWWQIELKAFSSIGIDNWCIHNVGERYVEWRSPSIRRYWFKEKEDAVLFELTWCDNVCS